MPLKHGRIDVDLQDQTFEMYIDKVYFEICKHPQMTTTLLPQTQKLHLNTNHCSISRRISKFIVTCAVCLSIKLLTERQWSADDPLISHMVFVWESNTT